MYFFAFADVLPFAYVYTEHAVASPQKNPVLGVRGVEGWRKLPGDVESGSGSFLGLLYENYSHKILTCLSVRLTYKTGFTEQGSQSRVLKTKTRAAPAPAFVRRGRQRSARAMLKRPRGRQVRVQRLLWRF